MMPRQPSSTTSSAAALNSRKVSDRMIMKIGSSCDPVFNVGDKVKVITQTEEELKRLQEGHGGWNPRMARFIGRLGTIHRTTENGDLRVKFEDSLLRWTFNPVALIKVPTFSVGDVVRVLDDMDRVKELQQNHGEWVDQMRYALGKRGKVVIVYRDNDLRVTMTEGTIGTTYTLNPYCVALVSPAAMAATTSDSSSNPVTTTTNSTSISTNASSSDNTSQQQQQLQPLPPPPMPQQHQQQHSCGGSSGSVQQRTSEISDLLSQVQLRDTKFKCSRASSSSPSPGDSCAVEPAAVAPQAARSTAGPAESSMETVEMLRNKIAAIEDIIMCNICMEKIKNVAFLCGHGSCFTCSQSLTSCHMCRLPITTRINLY